MYGKYGKFKYAIFNVLFAIFYSAPIICFIYAAGIYGCTVKDNIETTQDALILNNLAAEDTTTNDIVYTEPPTILETVETTEPTTEIITETTETITITETTEIIKTTEPPPAATIPAATVPPPTSPPPPPPVRAAPENVAQPIVYSEAPQNDYLQKMFEYAVEIPKTDKNVEYPPQGRSIEQQWKIVPLSAETPEPFGYFKNIIFLGDSVTIGFDLYRSRIKYNGEAVLRDATVIASGSYGVFNSAKEISGSSIHPLYEGKQTLPENIIEKLGAKIVFICLGLNDVSGNTAEKYVEYYKYLIDRIKWKSPDKTVVIMSVTPTVEGVKPSLNNAKIMAANEALINYAFENDIPFMDYAAVLRDSNNSLYKSLASDGYCHLTIEAYNRLVAYILHHPVIINLE